MNPWRSLSSLPRVLWIVFVATLINRAGTMALPFLVLYLTKEVGFLPSQAGLLLTAYGVGALLVGPFAGKMSDRFGPVKIMKSSLFCSAAVLSFFPYLQNHSLLLAATVLWAMVSEAFRPASMALVTDVVAPGERKIAITVIRLAVNVGMSIGPAVGGFVLLLSYNYVFWIDAGTSLIAGFLLLMVPWHEYPLKREPAVSEMSVLNAFRAFGDWRMLSFLMAMIPVYIIFFQYESTVPLFMVHDLGMDEQSYGMLFPINTFLIILLEIPLNIAMAHWSHRSSLMLGAALVTIGFAATGLAWNFPTLALTVIVWTFGEMILVPSGATFVADIAPEARRGEYMGIYQMCFSFSFGLSGWVGTRVYEVLGPRALWGGILVAGALSVFMTSRMKNTELSPTTVGTP